MTKSFSHTIENKLYVEGKYKLSCDYHRIINPYNYLRRTEYNVPIFWFNRIPKRGVRYLDKLKSLGVKIVMDLDDNFDLDESHIMYGPWYQCKMDQDIKRGLELADVVMVTNQQLLDVCSEFNDNLVVVPNALPFGEDQFQVNRLASEGSRYVYVGGSTHKADSYLMDFDYGELTVAGFSTERWKVAPTKTSKQYMSLYDGHKAAVAPLRDNAFNRCKSNLKLLEAGSKGLPLFASDCLPYSNEADRGIVQLVGKGVSWKSHLGSFKDSELAELGAITQEHVVKNYSLWEVNKIREQVFSSF